MQVFYHNFSPHINMVMIEILQIRARKHHRVHIWLEQLSANLYAWVFFAYLRRRAFSDSISLVWQNSLKSCYSYLKNFLSHISQVIPVINSRSSRFLPVLPTMATLSLSMALESIQKRFKQYIIVIVVISNLAVSIHTPYLGGRVHIQGKVANQGIRDCY